MVSERSFALFDCFLSKISYGNLLSATSVATVTVVTTEDFSSGSLGNYGIVLFFGVATFYVLTSNW